MTVASTSNRINYTATVGQTVFAYPFKVFAATDLLVYAGGVLQILNTDYTVSGVGVTGGGNVTFTTAPGSGVSIVIVRQLPLTQLTDYVEGDPFPAASHENALDRIVMIAQQFDEAVDRMLTLPITSLLTNIEVPVMAGKPFRWNSGATALENFTIGAADALNVITTEGDLIQGGAGGIAERLAKGSSDNILMEGATKALWKTTSYLAGLLQAIIKLDDLVVPDDNTDLNVSITQHGLCPKAPNDATKVLRGGATPDWGYDKIVQQVHYETGAVATGTTLIPFDDTVPVNTEGNEYMTLAITPKSATNILLIEAIVCLANDGTAPILAAAIFQDTVADAIVAGGIQTTASYMIRIQLRKRMTAGTTSATTFKVRAGANVSGTTTLNGTVAARKYGGILLSSITITEIAA